jgi:hypothetical protein
VCPHSGTHLAARGNEGLAAGRLRDVIRHIAASP